MENANKKNNVLKGVGVAAAGAVLLGGLATYASWSDSTNIEGGTIQSGQLAVEHTDTKVQDTSPARGGVAHDIDLATWKAVPGDQVTITAGLDIAVEGDNILAALDASALKASIPQGAEDYVSYTIELQNAADNTVIASGDEVDYLSIEAPRDGQGDEDATYDADIVSDATLDNQADVNAVITVNFDPDTPEQVLQSTNLATISDGPVTLKQIIGG